MYYSRRKIRQYRKRVSSRKNKTRSKRKYLKFRKMRGGMNFDEFKAIYDNLRGEIQAGNLDGYDIESQNAELTKLKRDYPNHVKTLNEQEAAEQKQASKLSAVSPRAAVSGGPTIVHGGPGMDPANWQ